jgi:hypothetical protein
VPSTLAPINAPMISCARLHLFEMPASWMQQKPSPKHSSGFTTGIIPTRHRAENLTKGTSTRRLLLGITTGRKRGTTPGIAGSSSLAAARPVRQHCPRESLW